jgi:hypothetical protein
MRDKSGTPMDIRTGNAVRIRRTWRSPHAGRSGVVLAIEPNDDYGAYIIEFEDGLHFRYHRQELEPVVPGSAHFYQHAVGKLCGFIRLFVRRPAWSNGTTSSLPPSNLDHVYASSNLQFSTFVRPSDNLTANVSVRGWVDLDTAAKKDKFIKELSDHSLLFFEVRN